MASLEKTERIAGVGLVGVPTFDFFVWALDNYARGELLMTLREQLPPWLLNPAFVFVCMCGGLALLYLSHQQQLRRILARPSQLVDIDEYRGKERPGWLVPLLWVAFGALIAAPALAFAYTLRYKGALPPQAHLRPPPICKTADCWPKKAAKGKESPVHIEQKGTNNIAQVGNNNQATIEAKPLVRAMVVEAQIVCDVREGTKPPESFSVMMVAAPGAIFRGLARTTALSAHGTVVVKHYPDESSPTVLVQEWFTNDEAHGLIGAPIEDLINIT